MLLALSLVRAAPLVAHWLCVGCTCSVSMAWRSPKVPLKKLLQYDAGMPDGRSGLENPSRRSNAGGTETVLGRPILNGVLMWTKSQRCESHETINSRDSAVTRAVASGHNGQEISNASTLLITGTTL